LDVVNYLAHGISKIDQDNEASSDRASEAGNSDTEAGSPLDKYTTNLNEEALQGRIDPLIGRELELERTIQTLCRRRKNNPLLVAKRALVLS
jgi:ATP-dependent Clp protease ATP-binding subunit ClpA